MRKIKEHFKHHGVHYTLLKRDGKIALFGVGSKTSSAIRHWEIAILYRRKDKYGDREALPTDSQFGRDRSRYFMKEIEALEYYKKLTSKLYQGVSKVVSGLTEEVEPLLDYHLV